MEKTSYKKINEYEKGKKEGKARALKKWTHPM